MLIINGPNSFTLFVPQDVFNRKRAQQDYRVRRDLLGLILQMLLIRKDKIRNGAFKLKLAKTYSVLTSSEQNSTLSLLPGHIAITINLLC